MQEPFPDKSLHDFSVSYVPDCPPSVAPVPDSNPAAELRPAKEPEPLPLFSCLICASEYLVLSRYSRKLLYKKYGTVLRPSVATLHFDEPCPCPCPVPDVPELTAATENSALRSTIAARAGGDVYMPRLAGEDRQELHWIRARFYVGRRGKDSGASKSWMRGYDRSLSSNPRSAIMSKNISTKPVASRVAAAHGDACCCPGGSFAVLNDDNGNDRAKKVSLCDISFSSDEHDIYSPAFDSDLVSDDDFIREVHDASSALRLTLCSSITESSDHVESPQPTAEIGKQETVFAKVKSISSGTFSPAPFTSRCETLDLRQSRRRDPPRVLAEYASNVGMTASRGKLLLRGCASTKRLDKEKTRNGRASIRSSKTGASNKKPHQGPEIVKCRTIAPGNQKRLLQYVAELSKPTSFAQSVVESECGEKKSSTSTYSVQTPICIAACATMSQPSMKRSHGTKKAAPVSSFLGGSTMTFSSAFKSARGSRPHIQTTASGTRVLEQTERKATAARQSQKKGRTAEKKSMIQLEKRVLGLRNVYASTSGSAAYASCCPAGRKLCS